MSRRALLLYALLVLVTVAVALFARAAPPRSELASVENAGPRGLKALRLYLDETGHPVLVHREPLTALPPGTATVVLPEPAARPIDGAELEALERFVAAGGTLVYLAAGDGEAQPILQERLGLAGGGYLEVKPAGDGSDPTGTSAEVWIPSGPLAGVERLRVAPTAASVVSKAPLVPVAGKGTEAVLWLRREGKGLVLVGLGASIAANQRLRLDDNLQLWANLAANGPILFDELHHLPLPAPPASRGMVAVLLQFGIAALVFIWARGSRLGPPRPEPLERHRSSLEYLQAFAWLTRRAQVEPELLREAVARLRRLMHEREGIPVTLPHAEAALKLEETCAVDRGRFLSAVGEAEAAAAQQAVAPRRYQTLVRALAAIEDVLSGR